MSVTGDTSAPSSRDDVLRMALRLLETLRDEGAIVFTSELDCVGWYNEGAPQHVYPHRHEQVDRRRLGARVPLPATRGRSLSHRHPASRLAALAARLRRAATR